MERSPSSALPLPPHVGTFSSIFYSGAINLRNPKSELILAKHLPIYTVTKCFRPHTDFFKKSWIKTSVEFREANFTFLELKD